MDTLYKQFFTSIIRTGLLVATGYFVHSGIWSQTDAETYMGGAAVVIVTTAWSWWEKHHAAKQA